MPNHKINWVNDHTQICDRLDERVQHMQDYLDSKSEDFEALLSNDSYWDRHMSSSHGVANPSMRSILSGASPAGAPWRTDSPF